MKCEFCGGDTVIKRVRKLHWMRGKLHIIENVAAEVCQECGERYYHATTLDAIDRLLEFGQPAVQEWLTVPVIGIAVAAG